MPQTIVLTPEQKKLFVEHGSIVITDKAKYYYYPYWLREAPDGTIEVLPLVDFSEFPKDLVDAVNEMRDGKRG